MEKNRRAGVFISYDTLIQLLITGVFAGTAMGEGGLSPSQAILFWIFLYKVLGFAWRED